MLIQPFQSVGIFIFNEKRQQVRSKANEPFEPGVKEFQDIKENYDYFPNSGFFAYYDDDDRVVAIEFFEPNPVFEGVNLLKEPFVKLVKMFQSIDPNLIVDESSFISNLCGIVAHCPYTGKDGMSPPESVLAFSNGYYG